MDFLSVYLVMGAWILGAMTALWLLSLLLKDTSIVDLFWGLGFVMSVWVAFTQTPDGLPARKWLIAILTTIWGLRLFVHLALRNIGKGEDFRYAQWRKEHGSNWWWYSFFQTFLLQGALMWVISAPLLAAQRKPTPAGLSLLDFLGIVLWAIGFFFEAVGDWQLARFKADPANKGKVLDHGVWRYTRHPNYFGDSAQWWGYYLIAAAAGGWWTVFSPILMTFMLVRVSGVAMLEKSLKNSKPGYKEYRETTSAFLPWFPKKRD